PGGGDAAWRGRLAETGDALGDLLARSARHAEARIRYDEALAAAPPGDRLTTARLHRKKARSCWTVHAYDDADSALELAAAALGDVEQLACVDERREWIDLQQDRFWLDYFARRTGPHTEALVRRMEPVVMRDGTALQRCLYHQCVASDRL